MRVFVDANIPMYAAGRDHTFKTPAADFMLAVARRRVEAVSDVEVLQEILYRYAAVRRPSVGFVVFESFVSAMLFIHPVVPDDLRECRRILARHDVVQPRDAIHAAVMRRIGIRAIVSYDRHFDTIPGIDRVTPDEVL